MPPVDCPFYFEDSYRKATRRACRLIARNPQSEPWQPGLCRSCPVPGMLKANPCIHLALEARVVRKWGGLVPRVEPYTVCSAKLIELANPHSCWRGCDQFTLPGQPAEGLVSVDELMKTVVPDPTDS